MVTQGKIMRPALLGGWLLLMTAAMGQEPLSPSAPPGEAMILSLNGTGSTVTRAFIMKNSWSMKWRADGALRIQLMSGGDKPPEVVTDTSGTGMAMGRSSTPEPPGTYTLQVTTQGNWMIMAVEGNAQGADMLLGNINGGMGGVLGGSMQPTDVHFEGVGDTVTPNFTVQPGNRLTMSVPMGPITITLVPADGSASTVILQKGPPDPSIPPTGWSPFGVPHFFDTAGTYHLEIKGTVQWSVKLWGASSGGGLAATPQPPAAPVALNPEVMKAVVLIKGDRAEGTGFLVKMPDGPAVVTNVHVLAANPNFKITTSAGATVEATSMKGASDRDLALISIKDAGYTYLDMATDVAAVAQPGDEVVTPGNSQGGGVMLNTGGRVLGVGPDRLEIDNPIYHGNSGGPIYHTKSKKVVGVVTEARKVDTSNALDKVSSLSRNSAIQGEMRYFGMRLDNVSQWLPVDWRRFLQETQFLIQFHQTSMQLDSYLNGDVNHPEGIDPNLYLKNDQLMRANDGALKASSGGDAAQRMDALRQFVFDMEAVADSDMKSFDSPNNFYSFNWPQAQDERNYRQALKNEIEGIGNDVSRLNGLAHRN